MVAKPAVSPDSTVIAGGTDDGYLLIWDAATGDLRHSLTAHRDYIADLVFTLDGTRLVTSGGDCVACVWDLASGQRLHTLVHHQRLRRTSPLNKARGCWPHRRYSRSYTGISPMGNS